MFDDDDDVQQPAQETPQPAQTPDEKPDLTPVEEIKSAPQPQEKDK